MNDLHESLINKPSVGVRIDYGNPLAHGLWFCYLLNEAGGTEAIDCSATNNGPLLFVGTPPEWTTAGIAVGNGKGYLRDNRTVRTASSPISGSHTLRVVHIPRTWPGTYTCLFEIADATPNRILSLFIDTSGNLSYYGYGNIHGLLASPIGMVAGEVNDLVWVVDRVGTTGYFTFYLNGKLVSTTSAAIGTTWPTSGHDMALGGNPSTGGSLYDGQYIQVQGWTRGLSASEVADLYANPFALVADGPMIFGMVPPTNATATATFGTVTLTAPTATAFQAADNTATATFGTITLTAPTAEGSQAGTATATFGTITLTAPSASGISTDSTASASFGIIYLQAPTAFPYGPPFFAAMQDRYYWGRYSRGQYMNLTWLPEFLPDDIAEIDFWHEATTIVKTVSIPVLEEDDAVFGRSMLVDGDMVDGNYVAVIRFQSGTISQCAIGYFQVIGGTGEPAVVSLLEIDRPLGRAVITQDSEGLVMAGYDPRTGE